MTSAVAACAAAGAIAVLSLPAVAGADTIVPSDPCVSNPNLPTCVNDAFDRTIAALETVRWTYNNDIQPVANNGACQAYTLLTGKPCPGLVPTI
jgi:hypothetical protein